MLHIFIHIRVKVKRIDIITTNTIIIIYSVTSAVETTDFIAMAYRRRHRRGGRASSVYSTHAAGHLHPRRNSERIY